MIVMAMTTRGSRVTDFCHRMKMKCIGKENPPCNRCRQSGHQCTFDGPRKSKASKVEDRLKVVEEQMSVVQSSLSELISLQRASLQHQQEHSGSRHGSHEPISRDRRRDDPYPVPQPILNVYEGRHSSSSFQPAATSSHPPPTQGYNPSPLRGEWSADGRPSSRSGVHRPPSQAEDNSGVPSDEDEDEPLEPSAVIFNNMLSLAEAARLKADGHYEKDSDLTPEEVKRQSLAKSRTHLFDYTVEGDERSRKRARLSGDAGSAHAKVMHLQRPDYIHPFPDPVEKGIVTEDEGRELFQTFMEGGLVYVPILQEDYDTWDSVRRRSPFLLSAMIGIGCKIRDSGKPPSDLQKKLKGHAESIGMNTLFTPVAQIEVLQGMILLASWGDTSWRPGGHAVRMGMDMGLYRCLPYLAQCGMGGGKPASELQEERPLVVGARCWLSLYKTEFEMAFNLGRPALFAAEDTIKHCRWFLEHPLSIQSDVRLVSTCELLTLRIPMHQPFSIWPSATRIPDIDDRIQEANDSFVTWFKHWDEHFTKIGVEKTTFMRESLLTQYSHAVLHTNCRILHGVRSRRDLSLLSERRVDQLKHALHCAETLVSMPLRSVGYKANFTKANHYTHVGVAFAARLMIRLASLMPEAVGDLAQIADDLEAVTDLLAAVPGYQFAQQIRDLIQRARRKHILPPASKRSTSPASGSAQQGGVAASEALRSPGGGPGKGRVKELASNAPSTAGDSVTAFTPPEGFPLDFFYAEQLFSTVPDLATNFEMPQLTATPGGAIEPVYNLDSWFPYPALDSDGSMNIGIQSGQPGTQLNQDLASGGRMIW
ncbi:Transcriptional activator of proteases prtT [Vanrija pseudolonga]|uniref:Transcriptional activator of proteases prtT n=1 Tax=Vanrija pseudolonga TaxID=143232 RepID=A0AAF0Y4N0_9TREE|nr:Transcriptional activator of proteases prtT [Vanrija pseudolonga]